MPTYDVRCLICNGTQELSRSMDDDSPLPLCCGMTMQRKWDSPLIKFNGRGFYSTGG